MEVRDGAPGDISFIFATWLKGLYYGNDWFQEINQEYYFRKYHDVIELLLTRPQTQVKVACLKDDPDVILGYSVFELTPSKTLLHWVFAKPAWRRIGIAKRLIPPSTTEVTHMTKIGKSIKPKEWLFNPFLT